MTQHPPVKFADVIHLSTSRTADPASAGIDRFVGLEHIEPENLHIRSWGNIADGTTFTSTFKRGQVLFGKRRAYQRKVAVADFDGVCSSDIYVFESKDPNVLLPELVPFICQSEGFYDYAVKTSAGSLSPRTNWSHLANYEFPLPPVDEQRRIADLLWAADDSINAHREFVDRTVDLRASFVRSVTTKTNELCKDAQISTLGNIAEIIVGQSPSGDSYNFTGNGIPLLNGPTEFGEVYPVAVQWTTKPTKLCKPGDILFCVRGSTTGRQNISDGEYCIGRGLSAIRGKADKSVTGFLKIILEGLEGEVLQEAKGAGSTFPNITSKRLSELKLPFIDLEKQNILAEQFLSIHNFHVQANAHMETLQGLKKTLLNKVLAG